MANNLWALLEPSIRKNKHRTAWIVRQKSGRRTVTYNELYWGIIGISRKLTASGIRPGDTVGIFAPNGPEWTAAALAAWRAGASIAPIHIGNSEYEVAGQLAAVSPKLLLVHDAEARYDNQMTFSLDDKTAPENIEGAALPVVGAEDVAVRIYTSGSTGQPKIVKLSHGNHISNVVAAGKIERFTARDRFLSLLPSSHAMGLIANLFLPIYCGAAMVSPRVLAAKEIIETLSEEKISVVIAVPRLYRNIKLGLEKKLAEAGWPLRMYIRILKCAPQSIKPWLNGPIRAKFGGRIKVWVSGGSHLDGEISKYYHSLGLPLRQGYGLTETAPLISMQAEFDSALQSVGAAIEHVSIKINEADENGNGEVWIKGPNVMLGYENPEQNKQAFEDGWFKTGDIGRIDSAGRLTLTGRSKRLIVTEAGKNVYPEELETLLERNPEIKEAGVLENDMKPVCVIAMENPDDAATVRAVLKRYNGLVSAHNQITRFAVVEELPRTALGKIALQKLPEVFKQYEVK